MKSIPVLGIIYLIDPHQGRHILIAYVLNVMCNGSPIYNLFYMPDEDTEQGYFLATVMNNACAVAYATPLMIYGMGSRLGGKASMYPVVELSIMAHEFTHMVTDRTAELVYQGEPGADRKSVV